MLNLKFYPFWDDGHILIPAPVWSQFTSRKLQSIVPGNVPSFKAKGTASI